MLRPVLCLATNFAVLFMLSLVLKVLEATGVLPPGALGGYAPLLLMSLVFGFAGSVISLFLSKTMALRSTGAKVIERPQTQMEQWVLQRVTEQAKSAGSGMPDVAIYPSDDVNAFATGASRNNGLVAVSTGLLQRMSQEEAEAVLAHEVAHMWFGNRVTIRDYADLWLSEGIVSYLTTMFYEAADGPAMARELRVRMAEFSASNDLHDARQPLVPGTVTDPMDLVGATVYLKGGCVPHLLRLTLGDDAFARALRRTYAEYGLAQRPLSTVAFQTLLEAESGRDLDAFFDYWVYGTQGPTLRTGWDNTTGLLTWSIEDDAGLLDGLAVDLQLLQEGETQAVALADGEVTLTGERPPTIRPVGVPMRLR